MAFTYSGDPSASMKDAVRFQMDDTDPQDYHLEDAEIAAVLGYFGIVATTSPGDLEGVLAAVVECMRMKDRRLAADPTVRIGNLTIDNTAAANAYHQRLLQMQRRLAARTGLYSGGISRADKDAARADPDRPNDAFRVGMHDFPGTQPPNEKPDPTTSSG